MATKKPSSGPSGPSAEELYRQARERWQQAVDLSLYDDPAAIRGTTGLLQKAIRQEPDHVKATALLSDLLAALTAYEEAAALVLKLRALEPEAEEHRRRAELLSLPNGKEKRAEIMRHLAIKWQSSADW
jgi:hypothetical protein